MRLKDLDEEIFENDSYEDLHDDMVYALIDMAIKVKKAKARGVDPLTLKSSVTSTVKPEDRSDVTDG